MSLPPITGPTATSAAAGGVALATPQSGDMGPLHGTSVHPSETPAAKRILSWCRGAGGRCPGEGTGKVLPSTDNDPSVQHSAMDGFLASLAVLCAWPVACGHG